ncbi:MAG: hypothetical protein IT383_01710 [Deltaproteobacteria bacterium]|nr:hypothetical protein [Deltaproteobacteria bacterium]
MRVRILLLGTILSVVVGCGEAQPSDPTGGVSGQLCDPVTRRPWDRATVTASFVDPSTHQAGSAGTTTDEGGRFALFQLPVTTVTLSVRREELAKELIVDIEAGAEVQPRDPDCDTPLPEPGIGELVGQTCNRRTGQHLAEGTVTVLLPGDDVLVADVHSDGSFVVPAVPIGTHVVLVQGPDYQDSYEVEITEGEQTLLEGAADCEPYDERATGMIVGRLCGPSEDTGVPRPLTGAHVLVVQPIDGVVYEEWSLEDGSFVLAGIPTPQAGLQVRAEYGELAYTWEDVLVVPLDDLPGGSDLSASSGCQELLPDED